MSTGTVPPPLLSCTVCTDFGVAEFYRLEASIGSQVIPPSTVAAIRSQKKFALRILGDSMLPVFREGDTVIIDTRVAPEPGDFVAVLNLRHGLTFRQYRLADGAVVLAPLNPAYPALPADVPPIILIGTMVEHRRRYREYLQVAA